MFITMSESQIIDEGKCLLLNKSSGISFENKLCMTLKCLLTYKRRALMFCNTQMRFFLNRKLCEANQEKESVFEVNSWVHRDESKFSLDYKVSWSHKFMQNFDLVPVLFVPCFSEIFIEICKVPLDLFFVTFLIFLKCHKEPFFLHCITFYCS